jgi:hypothetical protein
MHHTGHNMKQHVYIIQSKIGFALTINNNGKIIREEIIYVLTFGGIIDVKNEITK